jgi:hypothetical protein
MNYSEQLRDGVWFYVFKKPFTSLHIQSAVRFTNRVIERVYKNLYLDKYEYTGNIFFLLFHHLDIDRPKKKETPKTFRLDLGMWEKKKYLWYEYSIWRNGSLIKKIRPFKIKGAKYFTRFK